MRSKLVTFHRYLGLSLALFLIVLGLTGSLIAFQKQIEIGLNPELFLIQETGMKSLPATELVRRIEAHDPRVRVTYLPLPQKVEHAIVAYIEANPASDNHIDVNYDEVFINPITGEIKGTRMWGKCCFQRRNIMALIYKLHNRLLLPKPWGSRLLGTIGLLWVLLSLIGIYLTFPKARPFLKYWKLSWLLKWHKPWRSRFMQLHKSLGLWCWLLMLCAGLSGISMNLEKELFVPLVETVSSINPLSSPNESNLGEPLVDFSSAIAIAVAYAQQHKLPRIEKAIWSAAADNMYTVELGCQCASGLGPASVYVGAVSGKVHAYIAPSSGSAGDILSALRLPLHSGRIGGTVGMVLVSFTGLMTALLAMAGVAIWVAKRQARHTQYYKE